MELALKVLRISLVPTVPLYYLREQKHFLHSSRVADDGGGFGQLRIKTPSASQLRNDQILETGCCSFKTFCCCPPFYF